MNLFITNLWENPGFFLSWILFVVFSVCLHEYMHAFVALKEGDDTAATHGHLTLNPFKQMGIFSLIMLMFIGLCWGAVPVNRSNYKHKYSNLLVSMAGPFTNFILFLIFGLITGMLFKFIPEIQEGSKRYYLVLMFYQGSIMNIVLFAFNILPIPGFDGYSLIEYFVPAKFRRAEFFKGTGILMVILAFYFSDKLFEFGEFMCDIIVEMII